MASTQEILDAAKKIGEMVAQHDAAGKLEIAIKALEKDAASQQSLAEFNQMLQGLAQKEATGQPIEVAEKRQLETLQQAVVTSIPLRNFQMAQMDYVDLLRKIDEAITGETGGMAPQAGAAPAPSGTPDLGAGLL